MCVRVFTVVVPGTIELITLISELHVSSAGSD